MVSFTFLCIYLGRLVFKVAICSVSDVVFGDGEESLQIVSFHLICSLRLQTVHINTSGEDDTRQHRQHYDPF